MQKYHINPDTGRPNLCNPEKTGICKYAENGENPPHYESKADAKLAYESSMKDQELVSMKKTESSTESNESYNNNQVYQFTPDRLPAALHIIEKANRKLERAGISERFEYEKESKFITRTDEHGFSTGLEVINFTINKPTIGIEGSKFLAVVVQEDAGMIVKSARDVELEGWTPDELVCDKCGQTRAREKTYIIEDKDGNRMQVGSSCVKGYLGISPSGLWALEFDLPDEYNQEDTDFDTVKSYGEGGSQSRPVHQLLSLAIAVQQDAGEFVSNRYADLTDKKSTSSLVNDVLYGGKGVDGDWRNAMVQKAFEIQEDGKRISEVIKSVEDMEGGTDYANNIKVLAKGEWVSPRNQNLLISALSVLDRKEREHKKKEERKNTYVSGFTAEKGEKVKGVKAKIVTSRILDSEDYYGNPIQKTQIIFRDEEGHQMVWFASKIIDGFEDGDEVEFTGGSVKDHGSYKDVDQTILTRVKFNNESAE